jgi:hypothetical protein
MTFNTQPTQIETLRLHTFDITPSDTKRIEAAAIRALRPTFVEDLRRGIDITAAIPQDSRFFNRHGLWLLRDAWTAQALVSFVFQFKYWLQQHAVEHHESDIMIAARALEVIGYLDLAPPRGFATGLQRVFSLVPLLFKLEVLMFSANHQAMAPVCQALPGEPMLRPSGCWRFLRHC